MRICIKLIYFNFLMSFRIFSNLWDGNLFFFYHKLNLFISQYSMFIKKTWVWWWSLSNLCNLRGVLNWWSTGDLWLHHWGWLFNSFIFYSYIVKTMSHLWLTYFCFIYLVFCKIILSIRIQISYSKITKIE